MLVTSLAPRFAPFVAGLLLVAACSGSARTVTVTHGPVTLEHVDLGVNGPATGATSCI
jgi:hypothetical protein